MSLKEEKATEEYYIIQNITLGPHFVSDLKLQFAPQEIMDLRWDDTSLIKRSKDLKQSLNKGILKRLSAEEYERIQEIQYKKEKKQLLRAQQESSKEYKKFINRDNKNQEFYAERFDVDKASSVPKNQEVNITGYANHPMSFVTAYEIASSIAQENGDVLTADEFGSMVESDPQLVPRLLSRTAAAKEKPKSTAYVASDKGDYILKKEMTNYSAEKAAFDEDHLQSMTKQIRDAIDLDDLDTDYDNYGDDDYAESDYADEEDTNFTEEMDLAEDLAAIDLENDQEPQG